MTDRAWDLQQALADQVIRAYKLGPDETGGPRYTWPDGQPVSELMTGTFTAADLIAGIGFLTEMLTGLCFEIDRAQAEGRQVDVAEVLGLYAAFPSWAATQAGISAVPPEAS
jgi:hypothetical protein